jgi:hypothetical protein
LLFLRLVPAVSTVPWHWRPGNVCSAKPNKEHPTWLFGVPPPARLRVHRAPDSRPCLLTMMPLTGKSKYKSRVFRHSTPAHTSTAADMKGSGRKRPSVTPRESEDCSGARMPCQKFGCLFRTGDNVLHQEVLPGGSPRRFSLIRNRTQQVGTNGWTRPLDYLQDGTAGKRRLWQQAFRHEPLVSEHPQPLPSQGMMQDRSHPECIPNGSPNGFLLGELQLHSGACQARESSRQDMTLAVSLAPLSRVMPHAISTLLPSPI